MFCKRNGFIDFLAIDQPRAPNELAAGFALSEMYETPPHRRTAANLSVFFSGPNFFQPIFLHDQTKLGAPLDAAPPTSRFLFASTIHIANVFHDSFRLRISCSRASFCGSVLFETWQTKLGALALGFAPTSSEVLASLPFHRFYEWQLISTRP